MRSKPRVTVTFPVFRRLVAAGLTALVLVLSMLSASADAHKHLHADADHADHECAIVFLAQGVTLATGVDAAPAQETAWSENFPAIPDGVFFASSEYLLPRQCGPPASE